jgi:NADH-quinone oxidoreductase subunit C
MAETATTLAQRLAVRFGERVTPVRALPGQNAVEVAPQHLLEVARVLRDERDFRFEQLIDLAGIDYFTWGEAEWDTCDVSSQGFSRGVEGTGPGRFRRNEVASPVRPRRFASVVQLLSISNNLRLRLHCHAPDDELPAIPSLMEIWPAASWFERESFDLFGIVYEGHPDLRRLLTDYGFVGHPFRKDFPLIGNVEVRYDPERGRVVYEPVSIEPRVLVPRVVRSDSRYLQGQAEAQARGQGG